MIEAKIPTNIPMVIGGITLIYSPDFLKRALNGNEWIHVLSFLFLVLVILSFLVFMIDLIPSTKILSLIHI